MKYRIFQLLKRELILTLIVKFILLFGIWFAFFRPQFRFVPHAEEVAAHLSTITTSQESSAHGYHAH